MKERSRRSAQQRVPSAAERDSIAREEEDGKARRMREGRLVGLGRSGGLRRVVERAFREVGSLREVVVAFCQRKRKKSASSQFDDFVDQD